MKHAGKSELRALDTEPVLRALVEARLAWGLSSKEVAARIGCRRDTFLHFESGAKTPGFKTFIRWARVLGYDVGLRSRAA